MTIEEFETAWAETQASLPEDFDLVIVAVHRRHENITRLDSDSDTPVLEQMQRIRDEFRRRAEAAA